MYRIPKQESYWRYDGRRKQFFVYIMSNKSMTLYTGVTNDLVRRVFEHKNGMAAFTRRYHFDRLVYYEVYELITQAIGREKQIKGMTWAKKIALIKSVNPSWGDISPTDLRILRSFAVFAAQDDEPAACTCLSFSIWICRNSRSEGSCSDGIVEN